uniref:FAD-dependent oxidoreductase n=1 Tax=Gemmatimonas sp. TaxID=1962908 RepID=UPI00286C1229
ESWLTGTPGVALVREWARLEGRAPDGRFVVRAGDAQWHATRVYLNVGTAPSLPPIPGLGDVAALTNDSLLALNELPAELVVIGGSYIGLELGQLYARLGSRVTILEAGPAVASREDPDVSARITTMLEAEGLRIIAGVKITTISRDSDGRVAVTLRRPDSTAVERVTGTHVLVATGRRPCTDGLGLDTIGVAVDAQGYVPVNGALETSVAGVFALGDVNRRGAFTHTSYQDYEIVLANHDGRPRTADGRITTYAMYTDPPLGRIGLSETEARRELADGRHFLQTTIEMANVSRAKEEGETTGVIKLLVDGDTHRFAGITMLGIGADEVVQVIAAMMAADAPYEVLRDFLPIHPTITEFFPTMLGRLKPLA